MKLRPEHKLCLEAKTSASPDPGVLRFNVRAPAYLGLLKARSMLLEWFISPSFSTKRTKLRLSG